MAAHSYQDRISRDDLHEFKEHVGCFSGSLHEELNISMVLTFTIGIFKWQMTGEPQRAKYILNYLDLTVFTLF